MKRQRGSRRVPESSKGLLEGFRGVLKFQEGSEKGFDLCLEGSRRLIQGF